MYYMEYPSLIGHWIDDEVVTPSRSEFFEKRNPATGAAMGKVTRGTKGDVDRALGVASQAFRTWADTPVVRRGEVLRRAALLMEERAEATAALVALEVGKSKKDARAEIGAAVECGMFFAGEARRFHGETLPTAVPNRMVFLVREPVGTAALLAPFNNPFAGNAWKAFPALLSGNAAVIKAHEDTPYAPVLLANIFRDAGLPKGVLQVIQGTGGEAGAALVADPRINLVSLTGSVETGRSILKATADRLTKVSIEAGGKNPFVVCDDADLDRAATLAVQSAFVDAGQRCAAGSRIIVLENIYEAFRSRLLEKIGALTVGVSDDDAYGAIISERRMAAILGFVERAVRDGATLLAGGKRMVDPAHRGGYFVEPTVIEGAAGTAEISREEVFGPVTCLYRVKDFDGAVRLANQSDFKLAGAIHTKSSHRANEFIRRYQAGVVRVNGPTHGSEPHMPFGGVGLSGNGWREPGRLALDFYADWKQVSVDYE